MLKTFAEIWSGKIQIHLRAEEKKIGTEVNVWNIKDQTHSWWNYQRKKKMVGIVSKKIMFQFERKWKQHYVLLERKRLSGCYDFIAVWYRRFERTTFINFWRKVKEIASID